MEVDVVISWYATNKYTQEVRSTFQRPTRFLEMPAGPGTDYDKQMVDLGPTPIQQLCKRFKGDTVRRVALMGFSEGCRGVRAALRSGDGSRVDAAIALDGIHCEYQDPGKTFQTGLILPWRAFAQKAIEDGRLCAITTSSVVPGPNIVSTTVTSDWIWQSLVGEGGDDTTDENASEVFFEPIVPPYVSAAGSFGPGQASWKETTYTQFLLARQRKINGLVILNFSNLDPTGVGDHRFQADKVGPVILSQYLARRWNQEIPDACV